MMAPITANLPKSVTASHPFLAAVDRRNQRLIVAFPERARRACAPSEGDPCPTEEARQELDARRPVRESEPQTHGLPGRSSTD